MYRSNSPKHQRQINKVQKTEETKSDPPGTHSTESIELQLSRISFESTDSESDIDNTISVIIIKVENDYEPVIDEQPFHSHNYENQMELLQDSYNRPTSNSIPVVQEVNEVNTLIKPEKDQVPCSSTNHIHQNIQKKSPKEKVWTITILLESSKSKEFNHRTLK